jgi:hypothetical protein
MGKGWVGAANPVEGKVLEGVGTRLNQSADNTSTEGTGKQLNIQAAATTFRVVLD